LNIQLLVLAQVLSTNYLFPVKSMFSPPYLFLRFISPYQSVSILDFITAKDDGDGGDNWSYKTRDKHHHSPSTNINPAFTGWIPNA